MAKKLITLDKAIHDRGLTPMQVYMRAGCSDAALRNWRSKRNIPRLDIAMRLAALVGLTVYDIDWGIAFQSNNGSG